MNTMLEAMLTPYEASTLEQRKHALREVAQEIILCGLSRAGFFGPAAFYGGTALRMFYGLDRFSEDMDFSLRQPNDNFDLGVRKTFFDKKLALSLNCRDLFNSRRWETITSSSSFERQHRNWRGGRRVQLTVTWNFGNMKSKRPQRQQESDDEGGDMNGYSGGEF